MKKLQKRRFELYEENIEDVVIEISQDKYWRDILKKNDYNKKFLISAELLDVIPEYIKTIICDLELRFYVSKVLQCPVEFDRGLVIFKFESLEFPDIVSYSGNNLYHYKFYK